MQEGSLKPLKFCVAIFCVQIYPKGGIFMMRNNFSAFIIAFALVILSGAFGAAWADSIDLSTLNENYTAQDGDTLSGTTSYTLTIVDGASITLNNATINGGIVCAGTATITLTGTNSATGATFKAAIEVGGENTTLTIKGDGSLTATGGNQSAGIGLSRAWNVTNDVIGGNIVIEGGNITANGGSQWGAGIGTGVIYGSGNEKTARLGNITIKGGTVKATGGTDANGIGTGYTYGSCTNAIGTVTIYDDIDTVDASSIKDFDSVVYMHGETDVTASKAGYFTIGEDGDRRVIVPKDDTDYTITIADSIEHGTITGAATAKYLETVTITATPAFGYRFSRLIVKDSQNNEVATTDNTFLMPKGNVTVSAEFELGSHGTTEFVWSYWGPGNFVKEATIYDGVTTVNLQQTGRSYSILNNEYDQVAFLLDNDTYNADIPYDGGTGAFVGNNGTNFELPNDGETGFYDITMTEAANGKWSVSILKTAPQMDDIPNQVYTGSAITPEPLVIAGSLSLTKGTDYEYSYTDNTEVGTNAKVTVTFMGDYASLGSVENTFTIIQDIFISDGIEHGNVTADTYYADAGAIVTLTVTPVEGYNIGTVSYNDGSEHTIEAVSGVYSFTMPAVNVTISVTFTPIEYTITYDLAGGALAESVSNPATYTVDTETFTLNNPTKEGYTFTGWTGTDITGTAETVTIVKGSTGNRTYTAGFEKNLSHWGKTDNNTPNGTSENPYIISTVEGWNLLVNELNSGNSYSGNVFRLGDNLEVTTMLGMNGTGFAGTFEGNGKTLTFNYNGADDYVAPFRYVNGGTIQDLTISGTITASGQYVGGIVGQSSGETTIEACNFVGKLLTTNMNGTIGGGFVAENNGTLTISKSIYAPATLSEDETEPSTEGSATFSCNNGEGTSNFSNSYYMRTLGTAQGKQGYTVTAETGITVALAEGITNGLTYDGTIYAGESDVVSLTISGGDTKEGYTFKGYKANAETLTESEGKYSLTMPAANVTISANFTENVSYKDANGQDATASDYTVLTSSMTNLTAGTYVVKESVTVSALTLTGDVELILCDGATLSFTGEITGANSLVIYGQTNGTGTLAATTITLTENKNLSVYGGTLTAETITVAGTVTVKSATVNGEKYDASGDSTTSYTVTFDSNGGSEVTSQTLKFKYGETVKATKPADPTRDNYGFVTWLLNDKTYDFATVVSRDITLMAKWTAIEYTITYNGVEDATFTTANPTKYTVETATFTLTNPTKTGYTFTGWTGTGLTSATMTVTIEKGSMGGRSYTATWTPTAYAISYTLNGGTVTGNPTNYTIESDAITLNNPTRAGYTFTGWTGTGLNEATGTVTIAKGSTGNKSYNANWTATSYTITYELGYGSLPEGTSNPDTYTAETKAFTLTNPTREHYRFTGWTLDGTNDAPSETITIPQGSTGNLKYIANWEELPYFAYHSLILSGQIGVEFYAHAPDGWEGEELSAVFTIGGNDYPEQIYDPELEADINGGHYYGFRCYISSVQMADEIQAVLKHGDDVVETATYTAKEYLDGLIADTSYPEDTIALGKAIKNYGSYVQPVLAEENGWEINVDHAKMDSVDAYAESDFETVRTAVAGHEIVKDIEGTGVSKVEYTLYLNAETTIEVLLTPESGKSISNVKVNGGDNGAEIEGGVYRVQIAGISAHKLGNVYTITGNAGDDKDFTVKVSALSYVQGALNDTQSTVEMKCAVTSLYKYYDATMTYREHRPNEYQ